MNSGYLVVGAAAIVIGALFAAVALTHILPYREDMRNVDEVDAVVLTSNVVESTNAEGQRVYEPNVTYQYTFGGTDYTSSSVFPGDVNPVSDESRARDIVERYPDAEPTTAFVNTDAPERAFLIEQSVPIWFWVGPVVGALAILYGIYAIVLGVRNVEPGAEPA